MEWQGECQSCCTCRESRHSRTDNPHSHECHDRVDKTGQQIGPVSAKGLGEGHDRASRAAMRASRLASYFAMPASIAAFIRARFAATSASIWSRNAGSTE